MPFEVLAELRSNGEKSTRVKKPPQKRKRLNKNRPAEMSSRRRVSAFRTVIEGASHP